MDLQVLPTLRNQLRFFTGYEITLFSAQSSGVFMGIFCRFISNDFEYTNPRSYKFLLVSNQL